ncbi:MAG: hypothetical protein ACK5MF_04145 [Vibrio sp.]|uniref:hypothetical protein n=1 Tax=Vibrio sp. TaxID=678 RepID=UPI003A839435
MGGKSQSSSSNTTTTNTTNKSNSVGVGGDNSGIILSGNEGDINLTQTDHGAIDSAFEFGESALDEAFGFGENVFSDAINFGNNALAAVDNSNQAALSFANSVNASNATSGASDMLDSKFMIYMGAGVGVVMLLVIVMAVRK